METKSGKVKTAKGRKTSKTVSRKPARRKKPPGPDQVDDQVRAVLVELMCSSESDSVRVSAAKALMERGKRMEGDKSDDDDGEDGCQDRESALVEARRLLEELAGSKSGGADGAGAMDQDGEA